MPNKKIFPLLVAAFMMMIVQAMGSTLTVPSATYPTIASALTAANANDIIYIKDTYNPTVDTFPITITKSDLEINGVWTGWNPPTTTIYHPDSVGGDNEINQGDNIFLLDEVDNVSFRHIAFQDCNYAITEVDPTDTKTNIRVLRCTFSNCRNADDDFDAAHKFGWDGGAIHLSNTSSSEFFYLTINGCGEGIYLYASNENNVHHNTISENGQFGIMLEVDYTSNYIDYNTVTYCQDRGIALVDNAYNADNKYHKVRYNKIMSCNAEGLLIKGANKGSSQTGSNTEISNNHICSGNCNSGWYASLNDYGDDDAYLDSSYTNFGALALVDCVGLNLINNYIHCNGESQEDATGAPFDNGLTCFGGLAIIHCKSITFTDGALNDNTGDNTEYVGVDDRYNCAAYVYDEMEDYSMFAVEYCDIYNQIWGVRGEEIKQCVSAEENWWGNPGGPHHVLTDPCPAYNDNSGAPELNDLVKSTQWQGEQLAIELEGFRASPYTGISILLEWSTGSEQDNAGFYLVRSESKDSGFILLNNQIIPARGDTVGGADYSLVDNHITPNVQYYYWLVDISFDGVYTVNGPVRALYDRDPFTNPKSLVN